MNPKEGRASWPGVLAVVVACSGLIVVATLERVGRGDHERSDRFYSSLHVLGMEAEHYADLASMIAAADAVIVGELSAVSEGRTFGTLRPEVNPPDAEVIRMANAELRVERSISGPFRAGDAIDLEFMVPYGMGVDSVRVDLPRERAIFVLRNKATDAQREGLSQSVTAENDGYYRLIVQDAVFREIDGRVHTLPAARDESLFATLEGLPFNDFIALVAGNTEQE